MEPRFPPKIKDKPSVVIEELGVLGNGLSLKCCTVKDPTGRAGIPSYACEILRDMEPLEKPIKNILVNSFQGAQARPQPSFPEPGKKETCVDFIYNDPVECDIVERKMEGVKGTINELSCVFI